MESSDIRTYIKLLEVKNYFITYPIKNMVRVSYMEDVLSTRVENITDVHLKIIVLPLTTFNFAVSLQICIGHNEM
jgi:hypothetical protein